MVKEGGVNQESVNGDMPMTFTSTMEAVARWKEDVLLLLDMRKRLFIVPREKLRSSAME